MRSLGKRQKTWRLDPATRRKIQCSAIRLFHQRRNTIKFFTLTFSKQINHESANQCLSRFLENLTKNYSCSGYVVTREDHKSGVPHYHLLCDIPFIKFSVLNRAWFNSCRDFIVFSPCLLRTDKKNSCVVRTVDQVSRYISKYISKERDPETKRYEKVYNSRIYFIDQGSLSKSMIISDIQLTWLKVKHGIWKTIERDHFTIIYLYNFEFLPEKYLPTLAKQKKKKDPGKSFKQDPGKQLKLNENRIENRLMEVGFS